LALYGSQAHKYEPFCYCDDHINIVIDGAYNIISLSELVDPKSLWG